MEAELRQMMDDDKDHTRGAELVAQMEETLNLAFDEISFEMGFNGEKYELILTPEGDKVKLFELCLLYTSGVTHPVQGEDHRQVAYIAPPDSVSKQPWAVVLSLAWVGDAPLTVSYTHLFGDCAPAC